MNYSKWVGAVALLLAVASCGGGRPPGHAGGDAGSVPPGGDRGPEVATYGGSVESGSARVPARARFAVAPGDRLGAGPRSAADSAAFTMQLGIGAAVAGGPDSVTTTVAFRRRDLEVTGVSVMRFAGGDTTIVTATPVSPREVALEQRVSRTPRAASRTRVEWPADDRPHVYWDALPVWLRGRSGGEAPLEERVWLLPSLTSPASARPVDAVIRRLDGGVIRVGAGSFRALQFAISSGWQADVFWLNARAPHELLRVRTAGRMSLDLESTARGGDAPAKLR